jgi:hypothetical protein
LQKNIAGFQGFGLGLDSCAKAGQGTNIRFLKAPSFLLLATNTVFFSERKANENGQGLGHSFWDFRFRAFSETTR